MSFLPEVIGNLVGAGVGAFLGYLLGIHQEKKAQIEREENSVISMIKSIQYETNFNLEVSGDRAVLDLRSSVDGKEILTYDDLWIIELSTSVLESVMSSGKFNLLDPDLQVELSIHLMDLKKINRSVNRIESNLPMKKNQLLERKEKIDEFCADVLSSIKSIQADIQKLGYLPLKKKS